MRRFAKETTKRNTMEVYVLNPLLVTVYSAHTNGRTLPPLLQCILKSKVPSAWWPNHSLDKSGRLVHTGGTLDLAHSSTHALSSVHFVKANILTSSGSPMGSPSTIFKE